MNRTSKQIESELGQTTTRLDELAGMREHLNNNLEKLQQNFINGKTSLDNLNAERSKLDTLESSIASLEAKQEQLHNEFQKASLAENRMTLLTQAKQAAIEGQKLFDEYCAIRNEFNAAIQEYAGKAVDKMIAFRQKQSDYTTTSKQLEPKLADYVSLGYYSIERNELKKKIAAEIEQLGVPDEALRLITDDMPLAPPVEFNEAVRSAETIVAMRQYQEAEAG